MFGAEEQVVEITVGVNNVPRISSSPETLISLPIKGSDGEGLVTVNSPLTPMSDGPKITLLPPSLTVTIAGNGNKAPSYRSVRDLTKP
jgi:hypothetical protein